MRGSFGLLLVLVSLSRASWSFNPGAAFGVGIVMPLYSTVSQYQVFEKSTTFPWRSALQVVIVDDICGGPVADVNYTGRIICAQPLSPISNRCGLRDIQQLFLPTGVVAILGADTRGSRAAWGAWAPQNPPDNSLPLFFTGFQDPKTDPFGSEYDFFTSGGDLLYFSTLFSEGNATISLNYPDQNPFMFSTLSVGGYQAAMYLAMSWSMINMFLAMWKLSAFYYMTGKLQISIATIVIVLMFVCSFWVFLCYAVLGGKENITAIVSYDTNGFLRTMPEGFLYTGILVLGFYFGEVASLTSAKSVPGLDKLLIPSIIWIVITWAIVLSSASVSASDPVRAEFGGSFRMLLDFFFYMIGLILPLFCLLPLIWGSVILVKSLADSSSSRNTIIRVVVLTVSLFLLIFSLILMGQLLRYVPSDWVFFTRGWLTSYNLGYTEDFFYITGLMLCATLILLNFSVSVSKEIELSKSGTSSTSSSGSSISSSSSSSKSSDPVIEL